MSKINLNDINDRLTTAKNKVVDAFKNMNVGGHISMPDMTPQNFFESTSKLEDMKKGLDSDSDKEKMDAMKKLIAMISKGRDASSLFPTVVKNVISKNVELKKLVYIFLVHYAELEPDSALLAINTFQKDLGNSNQFIRSSALRVMSSIRVKIIVQLIMLAIQKSAKDSSPYVRKTTAHAISKVYGLDPEQKDQLVEVIKQLLGDRSTMVLGSALAAFSEVCPERLDLLHPNYRKFCYVLADIDEWGQIIVINTLIRYARTQFEDPNKVVNKEVKEKPKKEPKLKTAFDDSEEEEDESEEESEDDGFNESEVDPDLRLLLNSSLPLLKSRNTGVVLAVANLYYYLAPAPEAQKVAKSLLEL